MAKYGIERFLDTGWFPVETDSVNQWSWSKKKARLRFPPLHNGFTLELAGCPKDSVELNVYGKSKSVFSATCDDSFHIFIPPGIHACEIDLEHDWTPREDLGTQDARRLGICLRNVAALKKLDVTCNFGPSNIEIGVSGVCNINPPCVMCLSRNVGGRFKQEYLPEDVIKKIEPYFNQAEAISLHGSYGEPLLAPHLLDILKKIDKKKVFTRFNTNGLLLTEEISKRLIECGLKEINFSIDAATSQTYRKIRNNDGFHTIVKNITGLIALKQSRQLVNPGIIINMIVMQENVREVPDFIELAHNLGVSTVYLFLLSPYNVNYEVNTGFLRFNYFQQRVDPLSEEFKSIIFAAKDKAQKYGIILFSNALEVALLISKPDQKPISSKRRINQVRFTLIYDGDDLDYSFNRQEVACLKPWKNLSIDTDGTVRLCCFHDGEKNDNLMDSSFEECWNGKLFQAIRKSFLEKQFPKGCLACPLLFPQSKIW